MTQSERREYLIQYLLKEERRLYGKKMPADKQGQENLLRSLMNARIPGKHVFQRPRGLLFMVGFKRKDLVFFYGIMLFT